MGNTRNPAATGKKTNIALQQGVDGFKEIQINEKNGDAKQANIDMQEVTERQSKTRPAIPCLFHVATLAGEKEHTFLLRFLLRSPRGKPTWNPWM